MKTHVYIFSDGARASNYGIGTYIKQIINCFKDNASVSLNIVLLGSDRVEFTVDRSEAVPVIHIPNVPNIDNPRVHELYGRNVAYVLADYIKTPVSGKLIFHFNYLTYGMSRTLKKIFPECYTIYTIHFDPMCLGNKEHLQLAKDKLSQLSKDDTFYINEKRMYEDVDHIICLSTFMKELLVDYYKIPAQKISFIPNGIKDDGRVLSQKEKEELKQSMLIPCNEKLILFVGRLDEAKGVDVLLNSFIKVVSEFPDSKLVIVGEGNFRKYFSLCEGIWNKVTFTGMLDKENLYKLYRVADIGVMPSFHETFGFVAVEMMMHALPIVATATSGLNEVIDDTCGLKVPLTILPDHVEINVTLLSEMILYLLQHPTEAIQMGQNGRRRYLENYTLGHMYQKTKTVYHLK